MCSRTRRGSAPRGRPPARGPQPATARTTTVDQAPANWARNSSRLRRSARNAAPRRSRPAARPAPPSTATRQHAAIPDRPPEPRPVRRLPQRRGHIAPEARGRQHSGLRIPQPRSTTRTAPGLRLPVRRALPQAGQQGLARVRRPQLTDHGPAQHRHRVPRPFPLPTPGTSAHPPPYQGHRHSSGDQRQHRRTEHGEQHRHRNAPPFAPLHDQPPGSEQAATIATPATARPARPRTGPWPPDPGVLDRGQPHSRTRAEGRRMHRVVRRSPRSPVTAHPRSATPAAASPALGRTRRRPSSGPAP
ncbi:hypothetical protein SMICM304S_09225 [Streptomyces microflavus]